MKADAEPDPGHDCGVRGFGRWADDSGAVTDLLHHGVEPLTDPVLGFGLVPGVYTVHFYSCGLRNILGL